MNDAYRLPAADAFERWKPVILAVRSEAELVAVMAQFCSSLTRSDLTSFPDDCLRCEVSAAEEIAELAYIYTTAELRAANAELAERLAILARIFVFAAQQLNRLRPGLGASSVK